MPTELPGPFWKGGC